MSLNDIGTAFTVKDIAKSTVTAGIFLFGIIVLFLRSIKINFRLASNLGRKLFIYTPPNSMRLNGEPKDMKREIGVLRKSGFFSVPDEVCTDFGQIQSTDIKKYAILILGYDKEMKYFKELIELARSQNKPVIVYTFELGAQLSQEHKAIFDSYQWIALSSMPLRLVSDVFSIMGSFDYGK